jgi:hypothetical protein
MQLAQAGIDRGVETLGAIAGEVGRDLALEDTEVGGELGGNDWSPHVSHGFSLFKTPILTHLITDTALIHPLADPFLRLLVLIVV